MAYRNRYAGTDRTAFLFKRFSSCFETMRLQDVIVTYHDVECQSYQVVGKDPKRGLPERIHFGFQSAYRLLVLPYPPR